MTNRLPIDSALFSRFSRAPSTVGEARNEAPRGAGAQTLLCQPWSQGKTLGIWLWTGAEIRGYSPEGRSA